MCPAITEDTLPPTPLNNVTTTPNALLFSRNCCMLSFTCNETGIRPPTQGRYSFVSRPKIERCSYFITNNKSTLLSEGLYSGVDKHYALDLPFNFNGFG